VSGLAPRARGDSVRPRRLSDVVGRPLNFTVRSHLGKSGSAKNQRLLFAWLRRASAATDLIVLLASTFSATGCACGCRSFAYGRGARPDRVC